MENSIMQSHSLRKKSWGYPGNEWDKEKKIYELPNGMQEPSKQINIQAAARAKMDYYIL